MKSSYVLKSPYDGVLYRHFIYDVCMEVGGTNLTFTAIVDGEVVGVVMANYQD